MTDLLSGIVALILIVGVMVGYVVIWASIVLLGLAIVLAIPYLTYRLVKKIYRKSVS